MLSVVVPMYHTAAMLPELHRRIMTAVPATFDAELIYVDDACDEGSAQALAALQETNAAVHVETHPINRGQHHAIRTGLAISTGEIVVVLDGDLQDPPEAMPRLLEVLLKSDVDAVFAGKEGQYQGWMRMMTGSWFKLLMHHVADVPKNAGSYVAMTRRLVEELTAQQLSTPYLLLGIAVTRRPTTSIPVLRDERGSGQSATTTRTRLRLGFRSVQALWTERPR